MMKYVKQFYFTSVKAKLVSYISYLYCLEINNIDSFTVYGSQGMFSMLCKRVTKSFEVRW